jgi:hypothetical protein
LYWEDQEVAAATVVEVTVAEDLVLDVAAAAFPVVVPDLAADQEDVPQGADREAAWAMEVQEAAWDLADRDQAAGAMAAEL